MKPIKCHRISPDLPGHNIGYPRPILPCALRHWAPLPAAATDESFLALPGYIEASYVEFKSLDEVHLLFDQSQVLIGLFTKGGKGRVAVSLEGNDGAAVKLFRNWDGRPTLQVVLLVLTLFPWLIMNLD